MSAHEIHLCGSVAIVGRPNVGKSTLMNRFLGQKVAIVSPKSETTRERLLGILTLDGAQILFLDTPGIYRGPKTLLAKHQVQAARRAIEEADLLLLMTDAQAGLTDEDRQVIYLLPSRHSRPSAQPLILSLSKESGWLRVNSSGNPDPRFREGDTPVFLAINKVDRVDKKRLLPQIQEAGRLYPFTDIFPISATKGDNADALLAALRQTLPEGPPLYPPDQLTDRTERSQAQELIREKTFLFTHDEIPHSVAVLVEEWRPGKASAAADPNASSNATYIRATLYVERDPQKGILIGREGGLLKRIGQAARGEIQNLVGGPVFLELWVKVAHNWRKDPRMLQRLGYAD